MGAASGVLGVVGDLLEDVVAWLAEPLRPGTDTAMTLRRTRGGSAANVAVFAASAVPTRFLGCVGPDGAGDALVADLAAHGVDVHVQRAGTTGAVVVLVAPDGERTMLPDQGASGLIEDPGPAWSDGVAHLHATAYSFFGGAPAASTTAALLRRVRDAGGTTSVDASSSGVLARFGAPAFWDLLAGLRPTFLFANADEAQVLGLRGDDALLTDVLAATTVVVKDGPAPTTVMAPGAPSVTVPVPPVSVVRDLTGAGDAFAAGFLVAHLRGANPVAACAAGHALAAGVLASAGASRGGGTE